MAILSSQLQVRSADFQANAQVMHQLVSELKQRFAQVEQGGGESACAKHVARGKLLPRERVQQLIDPGSTVPQIVAAK